MLPLWRNQPTRIYMLQITYGLLSYPHHTDVKNTFSMKLHDKLIKWVVLFENLFIFRISHPPTTVFTPHHLQATPEKMILVTCL